MTIHPHTWAYSLSVKKGDRQVGGVGKDSTLRRHSPWHNQVMKENWKGNAPSSSLWSKVTSFCVFAAPKHLLYQLWAESCALRNTGRETGLSVCWESIIDLIWELSMVGTQQGPMAISTCPVLLSSMGVFLLLQPSCCPGYSGYVSHASMETENSCLSSLLDWTWEFVHNLNILKYTFTSNIFSQMPLMCLKIVHELPLRSYFSKPN